MLGLGSCQVLSTSRHPNNHSSFIVRKRYQPSSDATKGLPVPDIHIEETVEYHPHLLSKSPYSLPLRVSIPYIGDDEKVNIHGRITIEEYVGGGGGDNTAMQTSPSASVSSEEKGYCLQRHEMEAKVKVPLLGKLLERAYKQSIHRTYENLPHIVREWERVREEIGVDELLAYTPPSAAAHWISREKGAIINARRGGGGEGGGGGGGEGEGESSPQQQHREGIVSPQTPGPQVPEQIESLSPFSRVAASEDEEEEEEEEEEMAGESEIQPSCSGCVTNEGRRVEAARMRRWETFNECELAWSDRWSVLPNGDEDPMFVKIKRMGTIGRYVGLSKPVVTVTKIGCGGGAKKEKRKRWWWW
jgi:hypothetical protein